MESGASLQQTGDAAAGDAAFCPAPPFPCALVPLGAGR